MKTKVRVIKDDITKVRVDAIVNAANKTLLGGGGVDGAIHEAAGPMLYDECEKIGGCETGEVKITGGYKLPAKYIIHTVGPVYNSAKVGECQLLLASCYANSLRLAKKHGVKTIAFPCISAGAYRYPKDKAAKIAVYSTLTFIRQNPCALNEIIFVVSNDENLKIYQGLL